MRSFFPAFLLLITLLIASGCNNDNLLDQQSTIDNNSTLEANTTLEGNITINGITFDPTHSANLSEHWLQLPTDGTISMYSNSESSYGEEQVIFRLSSVTRNGIPGIQWEKEDKFAEFTESTVYALATDGAIYTISSNTSDTPVQFISAAPSDYTFETSASGFGDCIAVRSLTGSLLSPGIQTAYFQVGKGVVDLQVVYTIGGGTTAVRSYIIDWPFAEPQEQVTAQNTDLNITLEGNDVFDRSLAYTVTTQPEHGALSGTAPHLTYTPAADYVGNDSFTFVITNGIETSPPATVSIRVLDHFEPGSFVISVKTDNYGASSDTQFEIPTTGSGYNFDVDCDNDGIYEATGQTGNYTCDYAVAGTYTIRIEGFFPRIYFNNQKDHEKLISVEQWGSGTWISMENAFSGCYYLVLNATDIPDLSGVSSMKAMFKSARYVNQPIESWDVSSVTDMGGMFEDAESFNQPIDSWDVSSVTDMSSMFEDAESFNQPIGSWDVGSVTDMSEMFQWARSFNQPIDSWDVSNVTDMSEMFYYADSFNQPIDNWDVGNVTDMSWMFSYANSFNQPIDSWDVSSVTNMSEMFRRAESFNQPIDSWDVSSVTNMSEMFWNADSFNQPIDNWDVSSATDIGWMFAYADSFNQPIGSWDVSNVTDMGSMFDHSAVFNQPIDSWDVSSVTDMSWMFNDAESFNQPIGSWDVSSVTDMNSMFRGVTLSTTNYDALLTGWAAQELQSDVRFDGGESTYSIGTPESARQKMIDQYGWTITDGGLQ